MTHNRLDDSACVAAHVIVQVLSNEAKFRLWVLTAKHSGIYMVVQRVQSNCPACSHAHALAQHSIKNNDTKPLMDPFCRSMLIASCTLLKP